MNMIIGRKMDGAGAVRGLEKGEGWRGERVGEGRGLES